MNAKCARIRRLNDELRQNHRGGSIFVTAGVQALGGELISQIDAAVARFESFDSANDPYDEHDFGAFEVGEYRLFFKIDYYDRSLLNGSPDPSDPRVTHRVLTIMLAEEY